MIEKIYDFDKNQSFRYEVKFICYDDRYSDILTWIHNSCLSFRKKYPDRKVNSIYFDTENFDSFNENLSGESKRQKVRYRWYGENIYPTKGNLEIKHKRNNLGWKELSSVNQEPYKKEYNWQKIIQSIKNQTGAKENFYLNLYNRAVSVNSYIREYYQSFDDTIRITIDKNQKFYQQISSLTPNFTKNKYFPNIITVEVKCDNKYRKKTSELLQTIPIRPSRYSKFVESLL